MNEVKKRYAIYCTDLIHGGYVTNAWFGKSREVEYETEQDMIDACTKYRFKWVANIFCWLYNQSDISWRTFEVKEVRTF